MTIQLHEPDVPRGARRWSPPGRRPTASKRRPTTRRLLLSFLQRHVCLSMTELIAMAGLAEGTIRHHMRHLIKADMVTSKTSGRHRYFFCNGEAGGRTHWGAVILLQCPQNRQIMETVAALPGLDQKQVAHAVGLSQGRICIRLQALAGEGLVEAHRDGRRMRYYASGLATTECHVRRAGSAGRFDAMRTTQVLPSL